MPIPPTTGPTARSTTHFYLWRTTMTVGESNGIILDTTIANRSDLISTGAEVQLPALVPATQTSRRLRLMSYYTVTGTQELSKRRGTLD